MLNLEDAGAVNVPHGSAVRLLGSNPLLLRRMSLMLMHVTPKFLYMDLSGLGFVKVILLAVQISIKRPASIL